MVKFFSLISIMGTRGNFGNFSLQKIIRIHSTLKMGMANILMCLKEGMKKERPLFSGSTMGIKINYGELCPFEHDPQN